MGAPGRASHARWPGRERCGVSRRGRASVATETPRTWPPPAPGGESGGAVGSGATSSRLQLGELAAGVDQTPDVGPLVRAVCAPAAGLTALLGRASKPSGDLKDAVADGATAKTEVGVGDFVHP